MKAAFIEKHGGVDVLQVGDLPMPTLGNDQVLVRLKFSALNHLDIWVRQGLPGLKLTYPHILGCDGAGVIEKVGPDAKGVKAGDEVIVHPGLSCMACEKCLSGWETLCPSYKILGEHVSGTNAEFVAVPASNVFPKPKNMSWPEAASICLVFTTAWQMLVKRAQIREKDLVLIHSAGSGVGMAGIQIAKVMGAQVIATAGSAKKLELAKQLGADHCINYQETDFLEAAKKIRKSGVDIVFDHLGQDYWEKNIRVLKWGGTLVTCGATSGGDAKLDLKQVFFRQLSILGSTMGAKASFPDILKYAVSGRFRSITDKQFKLEDVASAHKHLESRAQMGKVVLSH